MSDISGSLALITPAAADAEALATLDPRDRRAYARLTPDQLSHRLTARHKYGEAVTLLDVSAGGILLETPRVIRPDTDLVLQIFDARTQDVSQVVSRVVRAGVASVNGGIIYRAACAFKRPLEHPDLPLSPPRTAMPAPAAAPSPVAAQPPSVRTEAHDFLKLELALKTIVEGYFKGSTGPGSAGRWRDAASLIDALARLSAAAERRRDPIDHHLAQFLALLIPALQRHEPADAMLAQLQDELAQHLPVLAIRPNADGERLGHDRERVTLNMCADGGKPPIAITAEFPPGFGLDAGQFRLLKISAYLVGLVGNWCAAPLAPPEAESVDAAPSHIAAQTEPAAATDSGLPIPAVDLPFGWHRIVVRFIDGQILRGYSNDFYPGRGHLHLCPSVNCAPTERLLVPISRLKAVFFVKDLVGNKDRVDGQAFDHQPRGRRVEITFRDGEVMMGSTLNYKPNAHGFFLDPASSEGNNTRIYVVTPAIRHMRFV